MRAGAWIVSRRAKKDRPQDADRSYLRQVQGHAGEPGMWDGLPLRIGRPEPLLGVGGDNPRHTVGRAQAVPEGLPVPGLM